MAETAAEKRKRLRAAIDRAKANPNASDKGDAGPKAVEAAKAASAKKAKAKSKKTTGTTYTRERTAREKKIDAELKRQTS